MCFNFNQFKSMMFFINKRHEIQGRNGQLLTEVESAHVLLFCKAATFRVLSLAYALSPQPHPSLI